MKEIGQTIKYFLSEEGKVFKYTGKEMSQTKTKDGYLRVGLTLDGTQKKYLVHRLIAEAFVPNPEGKPNVNHKDGNKQNNVPENLEWVTHSENVKHAYRTGLKKKLGRRPLTKEERISLTKARWPEWTGGKT